MKRNFIYVMFFFSLLLSFTFPVKAAESYVFDPNHTYVLWHINHFGFSNPSGKWYANGTLLLDEAKPQNSQLNVTIQVANIDTGLKDLDDHLKAPLFFDVAKFPMATFVSKKIDMTGKNTAKVEGVLTVHGISKLVALDVMLNKQGINEINNKKTLGFSASTTIKRSDFGITTLLPGLGDEVKINIEAEAAHQ